MPTSFTPPANCQLSFAANAMSIPVSIRCSLIGPIGMGIARMRAAV